MAKQRPSKPLKSPAPGNGKVVRLLPGLKIGHAHDPIGLTGCTVFLFDNGAIAAADVRGSSPATSNFSSLDPLHSSSRTDALVLTGGSSFGLSCAAGVQRFLEDRGQGFDVGVTYVPRVPTAGIFDLAVGDYTSRPTAQMALSACLQAGDMVPDQGSVGAGMGASVGKFFGIKQAMRGGFGLSKQVSQGGLEVWAFAVVNAFGDIWLPGRRQLLAGARTGADALTLADAGRLMACGWRRLGSGGKVQILPPVKDPLSTKDAAHSQPGTADQGGENTTLVAVITNARLDMIGARKLAETSHAGLTDVIYPAHTVYDGDLTIAVSIGQLEENLTTVCLLAQEAVAQAILNAVRKASGIEGLPCVSDLQVGGG